MEGLSVIISSVITLSLLGAFAGAMLAYASDKFKVEEDPLIEKIAKALPGVNCGACGYAGCRQLAAAIVSGEKDAASCTVGGDKVAKEISSIIGAGSCAVKEKLVARVFCGGGSDKCGKRFDYSGIKDCAAAILVAGGDKLCSWGCLGYGNCAAACKFDAMSMGEDGLPVIDPDKCTACGKCIKACPRLLIRLVPKKAKVLVCCSSKDKGAKIRKICKVGCIKCFICEKKCPVKAISNKADFPLIDHDKCEGLKECVRSCPMKTIIEL